MGGMIASLLYVNVEIIVTVGTACLASGVCSERVRLVGIVANFDCQPAFLRSSSCRESIDSEQHYHQQWYKDHQEQ